MLQLTPITYEALNARQKESYNYAKISAILADYGYTTMRLSDDWQGADFIAQHREGEFLKIQLKSRLWFDRKYHGKSIYIAFRCDGEGCPEQAWYLYPHDELLDTVLTATNIGNTESWKQHGGYSFPGLTAQMRRLLEPYRIRIA